MMKKLTSFFLGTSILLQSVCPFSFNATAGTNANISADRVIQLEYDESEEPVEIEVYEGEQIQLDFQLDSELYDIKDVRYYSRGKCAIVSPNGKFVGCKSGEDKVNIGVTDKTTGDQLIYTLLVNVLPNDSISDKNRNELNRLNDFEYDDYRRRKMELLGAADENAPRLTFEKIQEFIDNSENYIDIIKKVNNYIEYPDHVQSKGHESYSYWSDSRGNEVISIGYDSDYICYGKIADDGTFIGAQMLYPVKEEFYEDGKTKCQEYIEYNQIKHEADSDMRVINIEDLDKDSPAIELYEGETVQLVLPKSEPDMPEIIYVAFHASNQIATISHDLKLTGICAGEEHITVFIERKDIPYEYWQDLRLHILKNDSISAENRAELERLNQLDGFYRRKMELVGALDEDAPRLDMEKVQEIIDTSEDYTEILMRFNQYHSYADIQPAGGGFTTYNYWFDPNGNESICYILEQEFIAYTKIADDGTVIGVQQLYPEKTEFLPNGKDKSYEYIKYNQIKPKLEGYGTLNLKFIDESTDEPFTETNGTFQLIYNNDKGDIEIVKSWDSSEGSEITISELSRDYTYELRYIDKYHGEYPEEYKYEVSLEKGKRFFSFADDSELSCDIYLKKHILGEPYLLGDVNNDKMINVADAVTLQKWLMGKPNTVLMNWKAADLCRDDKLNIFDLCLMKNKLIKTTAD